MLRIQPGVLLLSDRSERVEVGSWHGEGSYARVYRATLPDGKGPCALKIAKPEISDSAEWLAEEQRVLEAVRHPHLVELLGAGHAEASPFLVLEWLEGEALHDLVRARRRLPVRQALEILEPLTAATAAIHARGMAHGDVRAQNVLVVPRRGAVLIDPGPGAPALLGDSLACRDVRCLGELLHLMVTGAPPSPDRAVLATTNGFSRAVVELWTRTQSAAVPGAAELQQQVGRVRGAL
jgi:serine/threonine protein kinase